MQEIKVKKRQRKTTYPEKIQFFRVLSGTLERAKSIHEIVKFKTNKKGMANTHRYIYMQGLEKLENDLRA